ncbi:hypothetical protein P2318_00260 [Myxococcaceae bacterium GXIMD 01537]
MRLASHRASMARRLHGLTGLALLLLLTGCASQPTWVRAGQDLVDVDFELPPLQQVEHLRQRGVFLPRASAGTADPRTHRDFVDLRVTAVGFGLTAGGYLLYCEGLPLPVLVPGAQVDLTLTHAQPHESSIYPDRSSALEALAASAPRTEQPRYAFYRGATGTLIAPTLFSPATTPRTARTMLEVRQHLSETTQRELKVLLVSLTGTKVLQGLFSRVVRMSAEPAPGLSSQRKAERASTPVPRQPAPPATAPPPPSSALVQALTGHNPTPRVAPGARLPQDVAVSPTVPEPLKTSRPIGSSPTQNAQLQADIKYLRSIDARNIRVNQQQLKLENGQRMGINRPDLQFDYNGRRYHVEYDTPTSDRGHGHQSRLTSNDPNAEVIRIIVP